MRRREWSSIWRRARSRCRAVRGTLLLPDRQPEGAPDCPWRHMPSRRHTRGPVTCAFRVRLLGGLYHPPHPPRSWRQLELAGPNPGRPGRGHPSAFDFHDPHLWAFFLSGSLEPRHRVNPGARAHAVDFGTSGTSGSSWSALAIGCLAAAYPVGDVGTVGWCLARHSADPSP